MSDFDDEGVSTDPIIGSIIVTEAIVPRLPPVYYNRMGGCDAAHALFATFRGRVWRVLHSADIIPAIMLIEDAGIMLLKQSKGGEIT